MVFPVGLDTPRTDADGATYMGTILPDISMEESFQSTPSNNRRNTINPARSRIPTGTDQRTPRPRAPLNDRENLGARPRKEFTPLLKSVVKSNAARYQSADRKAAYTPSVLSGRRASRFEASILPAADSSGMYSADHGSSLNVEEFENLAGPQMASSSATSTPLAMLPRKDGGGVLADGANIMSLREQENMINKIEKENFGLKLKIHFLEEALRKAGPGFSEEALKENTDLKVDKVTLSNELRRFRKTLSTAERELEVYQAQLAEAEERNRRRKTDEKYQVEIDHLKQTLEDKDAEIAELRAQKDDGNSNLIPDARTKESIDEKTEEINTLKQRIEDDAFNFESDIREKEREIDELTELLDTLRRRDDDENNDIQEELKEKIAEQAEQIEEIATLKQKIEEDAFNFESELRQKESLIDELTDEIDALKQRNTDENEQEAELKEKTRFVDVLTEEIDELKQRLQDKERIDVELKEKTRFVDVLTEENDELKQKLKEAEGLDIELDEKTRRVDAMTAEMDELKQTLEDKKDIDADLNERESIKTELTEQQNTVRGLEHEITQLKQQVLDLDDEIEAMLDMNDEEKARNAGLADQLQSAQQDVSAQRHQQASDALRLEELQAEVDAARQEASRRRRQQQQQDESFTERQQAHIRAQQLLEEELRSTKHDLTRKERQHAADASRLEEAEAELDSTKQALSKLRRLHEQSQHRYNGAESEWQSKTKVDQKQQQRIQELEEELGSIKDDFARQKRQRDNDKLHLEDLEAELRTAEQELLVQRSELKRAKCLQTQQQQQCQHADKNRNKLSDDIDDDRATMRATIKDLKERLHSTRKDLTRYYAQQEQQQQQQREQDRVRNSNNISIINRLQLEAQTNKRRHESEIRGLAAHCIYMNNKCAREEIFRKSLIYQKKLLTARIENDESFVRRKIRMLQAKGIIDRDSVGDAALSRQQQELRQRQTRPKPTLRVLAIMVISTLRMKRWVAQWEPEVARRLDVQRAFNATRAARRRGKQQQQQHLH
ncbi:MAG: hypothetical protein M1825_005293 [Sarcosagium campestre]|nr:MAG: hypothetical protein M1825_005293 [Sarcosagium campestre]